MADGDALAVTLGEGLAVAGAADELDGSAVVASEEQAASAIVAASAKARAARRARCRVTLGSVRGALRWPAAGARRLDAVT